MNTLCSLVHGAPGVGKTWLTQTSPAPRLVLDAEGGSRVPWRMVSGEGKRQKKVVWNPAREEPPAVGDWEVCYVAVQDFDVLKHTFNWLNTYDHPFRSVSLDSITEIQKRCKDLVSGTETLTERAWGDVLLKMEHTVRYYRDLVFHPKHPIEAVTFIALTDHRSGTNKPAIQGALSLSLPGFVDVEGYLFVTESGDRQMLINPREGYEAKDRTHVLTLKYGASITNPDIEQMLDVINESE